jgi:hypothetical protein
MTEGAAEVPASRGLTGLTAIADTSGLADIYVEGLGHHCATSAVTLQSNDTLVFDSLRQGVWLNAIAPICAAVGVVYM